MASCSGDKTVRLWERDEASREPVWYCTTVLEHTHTKTIRCVSWSPAGAALVTASFDGTTAIWRKGESGWAQARFHVQHAAPGLQIYAQRLPRTPVKLAHRQPVHRHSGCTIPTIEHDTRHVSMCSRDASIVAPTMTLTWQSPLYIPVQHWRDASSMWLSVVQMCERRVAADSL